MQKLKINDEVIILTGKDKGKTGKIQNLNLKNSRVLVEGINIARKALKPTQENPNGGFSDIEKTLHTSNVALISPETNKATRVRIEIKDNKKVRIAVACGSVLN